MPGDCFVAAGTRIVGAGPGWLLCHGIPTGTGGEARGVRYAHAWLETADGRYVREVANGLDAMIPRALYYRAGTIDEAEVHRYTPAEARDAMHREGHYGPWTADLWAVA